MVQKIPTIPQHIPELDFLAFLNQLPQNDAVREILSVRCTNCGAETSMPPDATAELCPFCGGGIVATGASTKAIRPQGLLPFKITQKQSTDLFRQWVSSLWFAPSALKKRAECSLIHGVYIPAWTYDSDTQSDYVGERGEHYWETESYTETDAQGNTVTRTREVQRTRWWPASGRVANHFDDLLVMASRTLPRKHLDHLEPWDWPSLTPYDDAFLSGFAAESYQISLAEGFETAKQLMDPVIRRTACGDIGGDEQRILSLSTEYQDITFKHLLLPVWISAYQFGQQTFRFVINARTGEVQGERPYSAWKIAGLVLGILAVILIVFAIASNR
jgi:predicted RNA-binding Zn-ribbon protein involved in translation (DUF1610 family)